MQTGNEAPPLRTVTPRTTSTYIDETSTPILPVNPPRNGTSTRGGGGWIVLLILLFLALIIGFGIYLNIKRYQAINRALQTGNSGVAFALAAPDIGAGVADVVTAFR